MCDLEVIGAPSILRVILNAVALVRMLSTCKNKRRTSSLCKLPDVLTVVVIKEISLEGRFVLPPLTVEDQRDKIIANS